MNFSGDDEPQWMDGCPCDEVPMHLVAARTAKRIADGDALAMVAVTGLGIWLVPRIYLAGHEFKYGEIPALAEQYGWEKLG